MRIADDTNLQELFQNEPVPEAFIYRQDSHAPMIVDILHGPGRGVAAAMQLTELVRECAARSIALHIEIPLTTLNAVQLNEQVNFLHALGIRSISLCDMPAGPPYLDEHDLRRHFSREWIAYTLKQVHARCQALGMALQDRLEPWQG